MTSEERRERKAENGGEGDAKNEEKESWKNGRRKRIKTENKIKDKNERGS